MIIRSKAPLRLGLAGGGTDVSPYSELFGGVVLNSTIDLYAYCNLELTDTGTISFWAADRDEYWEGKTSKRLELDGNLDLHKGLYNRIVNQFDIRQPLSFRMTTYSDVPAGSGLGSSSTLVVAMLKAMDEWLQLTLGDYELAHLAYEIERLDVGLSGGKQDQYAATFGGFNFIEFQPGDRVLVNPLRIKNWIINELECSMLLLHTGTSRESSKIIDEQTRNTELGNQTALQAMHELKEDAYHLKESILRGDLASFSRILNKSWESKKRMASAITNPRLDYIYDMAIEAGACAGKVTGAGGGGFMMFVVKPERKIHLRNALSNVEGSLINFHFTKNGTQAWRT